MKLVYLLFTSFLFILIEIITVDHSAEISLPHERFFSLVNITDSDIDALIRIAENNKIRHRGEVYKALGYLYQEKNNAILEALRGGLTNPNPRPAISSIFVIGGQPLDAYLKHLFSVDNIKNHYKSLDYTWLIDSYEDMLIVKNNIEKMRSEHPDWKSSSALNHGFLQKTEMALDILKDFGSPKSIQTLKNIVEYKERYFLSNTGSQGRRWADRMLVKIYQKSKNEALYQYLKERFSKYGYLTNLFFAYLIGDFDFDNKNKVHGDIGHLILLDKEDVLSYRKFIKLLSPKSSWDAPQIPPTYSTILNDYEKDVLRYISLGRDSFENLFHQIQSIQKKEYDKNYYAAEGKYLEKRKMIIALGLIANSKDKYLIEYLNTLLPDERFYSTEAADALIRIGGPSAQEIITTYYLPKSKYYRFSHSHKHIFNLWFHADSKNLKDNFYHLERGRDNNTKGRSYDFITASLIGRLEKAIQIKENPLSKSSENIFINILKNKDFHFININGEDSKIWALKQIIQAKDHYLFNKNILKTIEECYQNELTSDEVKEFLLFTKTKLKKRLVSKERTWLLNTERKSAMRNFTYFTTQNEIQEYYKFYRKYVVVN